MKERRFQKKIVLLMMAVLVIGLLTACGNSLESALSGNAVHGTVQGVDELAIKLEKDLTTPDSSGAEGPAAVEAGAPGVIPEGAVCVVWPSESTDEAYYVEYQGVTGYVPRDYIELGDDHVLIHYEAEMSSCMKAGNKEYWYCAGCGQRYMDEAGTQYASESDVDMCEMGHGGMF